MAVPGMPITQILVVISILTDSKPMNSAVPAVVVLNPCTEAPEAHNKSIDLR